MSLRLSDRIDGRLGERLHPSLQQFAARQRWVDLHQRRAGMRVRERKDQPRRIEFQFVEQLALELFERLGSLPPAKIGIDENQRSPGCAFRQCQRRQRQWSVNGIGNIMFRRTPIACIDPDRWRDVDAADSDVAMERGVCEFGRLLRCHRLPVSHGSVAVKYSLRNLLLERMFEDFLFVDRDAQARLGVRCDSASCRIDFETFLDNICSPRNVVMHRFADDVGRLRETELKRCRSADRSLGIMRCQCDSVRVGEGGDPTGFAEAAAVGNVQLANLAASDRETDRETLPSVSVVLR